MMKDYSDAGPRLDHFGLFKAQKTSVSAASLRKACLPEDQQKQQDRIYEQQQVFHLFYSPAVYPPWDHMRYKLL